MNSSLELEPEIKKLISHLNEFTQKFSPPQPQNENDLSTFEELKDQISEDNVQKTISQLSKLPQETLIEKANDVEALALKLDHEQAAAIERGRRLGVVLDN